MSLDASPEFENVLDHAHRAAAVTRAATPVARAEWLDAVADALDAAADELVPVAHRETHLPQARLRGEVARTTFQARLFATRLREGRLLPTRIDPADAEWPMGPRPDIRRTHVPIGPVLVFTASNFPFAFSVFGGDVVSALAAGCPVVVKVHPGHPELSRRTTDVVTHALADAGAPEGTFGLIEGEEDGIAAVKDPRVKAVGFTGSVRAGRMLFDLATGRPDPIPFYGELGSTNPVVVTPAGWSQRADDIAKGFAESFTLGSGQFCTKPGVIFVPDVDALVQRIPKLTVGPMLNERIQQQFGSAKKELSSLVGVRTAMTGEDIGEDDVTPVVFRAAIADVRADPRIIETECFGPAAIAIEYSDIDVVAEVMDSFEGSLTATVQGADEDDPDAAQFIQLGAEHAGRVIWNQWPTGVTVSDAQQHGGPWPATTAPTTTSVGTAAVERFLRPVAYQNVPQAALPPELRDQ